MTSAVARSPPPSSRAARAASSVAPVSATMIRIARPRNFVFPGRMFDMRLPLTNPSFIIVTVEIMLRMSFCAVPAFIRDEPVSTSGPTVGAIGTSAARVISEPGAQVTATVKAPSCRAYLDRADGVRRAARSGQADHRVGSGDAIRRQVARPGPAVVLGRLDRPMAGVVAASDDPAHQVRRHAVGWRALRRVEDAESSRGSAADIEQPPAPLETGDDPRDRAADGPELAPHRRGDRRVLVVDQIEDGRDRLRGDLSRPGIVLFGHRQVLGRHAVLFSVGADRVQRSSTSILIVQSSTRARSIKARSSFLPDSGNAAEVATLTMLQGELIEDATEVVLPSVRDRRTDTVVRPSAVLSR